MNLRVGLLVFIFALSVANADSDVPPSPQPTSSGRFVSCARALRGFRVKEALAELVAQKSEVAQRSSEFLFRGHKGSVSDRIEQYIRLIYRSRPANPAEETISRAHLNELLKLVRTTEIALFDRQFATQVYGKAEEDVTLYDAYLKLEQILFQMHQDFLLSPSAKVIDERVFNAARWIRMGASWLGIGLLAGLGMTIGNMAIDSFTFQTKARVQQASYQALSLTKSNRNQVVAISPQKKQALSGDLNDFFIEYNTQFTWPEHSAIDDVSYFEFKLIQMEALLHLITDPKEQERSMETIWQWGVRFSYVLNSEVGDRARVHWKSIWAKFDPSGELRKKFEMQDNPR